MKSEDKSRDAAPTFIPGLMTPIVLPLTISYRWSLSPHYLWGARHLATKADEIERHGPNKEPAIYNEHRAYVTGAIFSAVAFLEAAINECLKDIVDGQNGYSAVVNNDIRRFIAVPWDLTEGDNQSTFSVLKKYQLALRCCGQEALKTGEPPYQDANLVIRLRNKLMHYKTATHNVGDEEDGFSRGLAAKFVGNRLLADYENVVFFPDKCLSSGCAHWAVHSVKNLADEFFRRLGVFPPYPLQANDYSAKK